MRGVETRRFVKPGVFEWLVFALSLIVLMVAGVVKGPFISVDTHRFLESGNAILWWLGSGGKSFEDLVNIRLFPHYTISSVLLSVIYTKLGFAEWGVIAFNCFLFSLIVVLFFRIWGALYPYILDGRQTGWMLVALSGGMYILFGLPDGFLWSYAILTDIVFLFWVASFTALVVLGFLRGWKWSWFAALVVALLAPFVRPPGLIVPVLFGFALMLYLLPYRLAGSWKMVSLWVLVPAIVTFVVVPWLVLGHVNGEAHGDTIVPQWLERPFTQALVFYKQGVIISNRFELEEEPVVTLGHVLSTMGYRLVYFFVPLRFGEHSYSVIHNLVNGIYMILTLPLCFQGIKTLTLRGGRYFLVCQFVLMVGYGFALLHAVTLVSFDWRYQLPAMVAYWLVAGTGFLALLEKWREGHVDDDAVREEHGASP